MQEMLLFNTSVAFSIFSRCRQVVTAAVQFYDLLSEKKNGEKFCDSI